MSAHRGLSLVVVRLRGFMPWFVCDVLPIVIVQEFIRSEISCHRHIATQAAKTYPCLTDMA